MARRYYPESNILLKKKRLREKVKRPKVPSFTPGNQVLPRFLQSYGTQLHPCTRFAYWHNITLHPKIFVYKVGASFLQNRVQDNYVITLVKRRKYKFLQTREKHFMRVNILKSRQSDLVILCCSIGKRRLEICCTISNFPRTASIFNRFFAQTELGYNPNYVHSKSAKGDTLKENMQLRRMPKKSWLKKIESWQSMAK